jgi:hypothetical protein
VAGAAGGNFGIIGTVDELVSHWCVWGWCVCIWG